MKVTLTFDNGPHPEVTPEVLGVLRSHGIHAHFFVVGSQVRDHGDALLAQALADGHRIGNHSLTHRTPIGRLAGPEGVEEVRQAQALIAHLPGVRKMFRPFGGKGVIGPHLLSAAAWDYLRSEGYSCMLWNCLAYEWEDAHAWVEPTLARCRARAHNVVVLHDLPTGAMAYLDEFIRRLQAEGAKFSLDFPTDCLPLYQGVPLWQPAELEAVITAA